MGRHLGRVVRHLFRSAFHGQHASPCGQLPVFRRHGGLGGDFRQQSADSLTASL